MGGFYQISGVARCKDSPEFREVLEHVEDALSEGFEFLVDDPDSDGIVAVTAPWIDRRRTPGAIPAALVAVAGLALVLEPWRSGHGVLVGASYGAASAVCYAGNMFIVRRLSATIGPARAIAHLSHWLSEQASRGKLRLEDPAFAAEQFFALCQTRLSLLYRLRIIETADEAEIARIVDCAVSMFLARYGTPALKPSAPSSG